MPNSLNSQMFQNLNEPMNPQANPHRGQNQAHFQSGDLRMITKPFQGQRM